MDLLFVQLHLIEGDHLGRLAAGFTVRYGQVPEWLKGTDCKSVGSTPTKVRILPCPPFLFWIGPM